MAKYIFVTGGVLSSLGKGITSASVATLLKHSGLNVAMLKMDPYLNVDPGTISPLEHGEVFVTKDGAETDLDLGNYERFLGDNFYKKNNFTTGQVYSSVIERERQGRYLGKTIQVVPHITNEIIKRIKGAAVGKDILVVELGGTVGDMEGMPFLEAIRQIKHEQNDNDILFMHLTLVPYIKAAGELKTKPTQHSVQELRKIGITPQMIIARTEKTLPKDLKRKLALSCDVRNECVIEAVDQETIYQVPLSFQKQSILIPIAKFLSLDTLEPNMHKWNDLVKKIVAPKDEVTIGFVGKYLELKESYKSLTEALIHSGAHLDTKVNITWCDSEKIDDTSVYEYLKDVDGVLVPGGFGDRGIEGKMTTIKYARENAKPFLGICLGMQLALIEFSRNVLNLKDANSLEFDTHTAHPVIYLIDEFIDQEGHKQVRTFKSPMGATMRLGEYVCYTKEGSLLRKVYENAPVIYERHRHRYEANPKYRADFEKQGLLISGESGGLIEACELKGHPFFLGVQFHPEFTSKVQKPNRAIFGFIKAVTQLEKKI